MQPQTLWPRNTAVSFTLETKRKPLSKLAKEKLFPAPLMVHAPPSPPSGFLGKRAPFLLFRTEPHVLLSSRCEPNGLSRRDPPFRKGGRGKGRPRRAPPFLSRFFGGQGAQFSFGQPPFSYPPRDAATMRRRKRRKKLCL